jgi:hypothetical protein
MPEKRLPSPMRNPEKTNALIALAVGAGLGGFMILLPFVIGLDGMSGGFALGFVGFFAAITGLAVMVFFLFRAAELSRILKGEECLVHWRYDPLEWRAFTEEEYARRKSYNWRLWIIVGGMCFVVGLAFWIADHDAGRWVFLVMLGMMAVTGLTAYVAPLAERACNRRRVGECWIGRSGVYINGQFASWRAAAGRLENVSLAGAGRKYLQFDFSFLSRYGRQSASLRVPVPLGQENVAEQVLSALQPG